MSRTSRQRQSGSPRIFQRSSEQPQTDLIKVDSFRLTPVDSPTDSEAILQVDALLLRHLSEHSTLPIAIKTTHYQVCAGL